MPHARNLVQHFAGALALDGTTDGIVGTANPTLGFKVDVGREVEFGAADEAVVAKLVLHFTKQDAAGVHVGLCNDAATSVSRSGFSSKIYFANALSLSLCLVLASVEEAEEGDALHHTGSRVAEKLAAGFEGAIDADVVLGGHVKVAGLGRVVGGLLGNVVGLLVVGQVPVAGEDFAENRVEGLLDTSENTTC